MSSLIIKGGRVVDPAQSIDQVADVLIEDGRIAAFGKSIKSNKAKAIDAKGMTVIPGLIDMHAHLREPGREDEETITSGLKAAVAGGFTSVCCMPNTNPAIDNSSVVEMILEKAAEAGKANLFVIGAITKGRQGQEISEMADLIKAGVVAFSDDGNCVSQSNVMRRALEYSKMFEAPLIIHAEDKSLAALGQMNEGFYSTLLGLKGIPKEAEETIIARDLILTKLTGGRVHFTHLSSKGSVELVRQAKKKGIAVTADVTPHHLILTEEALSNYDTNLKINPPLRSKQDREALIEGLRDGTIDAIATDHAPHSLEEKEKEFDSASFGMVGLETALALVLTKLVEPKKLSLSQAIAKMTANPAKILNLPEGTLAKEAMADITVFQPSAEFEVKAEQFKSKSRNSPFVGWKLKGTVEHVLVSGKLVVKEGKIID